MYDLETCLHTLHRVTGIYLLMFVVFHIIVIGGRIDNTTWFKEGLNNPSIIPFVAALLFHGLNGLRLVASELGFTLGRPSLPIFPYKPAHRKKLPRAISLLVIVAFIISTAIVFSEFLFWWW